MNVLVTGAAGFIGFHVSCALLERGYKVIGIDNLNNYYDPCLKQARLDALENHHKSTNFEFVKADISDTDFIYNFFKSRDFDGVINLAAQAGVRYSLENPHTYIDSNINGFLNILEGCRNSKIKHLVYASSSSVYGMNKMQPFSVDDKVDYPISLYAATKKSNELMAHTYSHLYNIPTTGLRFFTVYGPLGRPDMAYYKFTEAILNKKPIDIYNHGNMERDFTYIDDIVDGVLMAFDSIPKRAPRNLSYAEAPFALFNIGNNNPIKLSKFIMSIEEACNIQAIKNYMPMQPGDVPITFADIEPLKNLCGFSPKTSIDYGIKKFVEWFKLYHKINL